MFGLLQRKCEQYWPTAIKEPTKYGDVTVALSEEKIFANYTIRTLEVERDLETRCVRQFHFLAWPDKTPPEHAYSIVEFRNKIRKYDRHGAGPMLVHCRYFVNDIVNYLKPFIHFLTSSYTDLSRNPSSVSLSWSNLDY